MNVTLKKIVATVAGSDFVQPLAGWLEQRGGRGHRLCVLTWHRIGHPEHSTSDPSLFSARPETFARQVEMLRRCYAPVSMRDVLAAQAGERPLPPRAVLVTFDDAYRDFAQQAWPILRRAGVPVTLFVATGFPGAQRAFWWDQLSHAVATGTQREPLSGPWGRLSLNSPAARSRALRVLKQHVKSLPHGAALACVDRLSAQLRPATELRSEVLDWDELRELARDGVELGLHTREHALLNRLGPHELSREIGAAWLDLVRNVADPVPAFAYPAGAVAEAAQPLLQAAGIRLAFTTQAGWNPIPSAAPWLLHRVHVGLTTTSNLLRVRLAALCAR